MDTPAAAYIPAESTTAPSPMRPRWQAVLAAVAVLVALGLVVAGCGETERARGGKSSDATGTSSDRRPPGTTAASTAGQASNTAAGPVTRHATSAGAAAAGGNESAEGFTRAFADCMRSHGVPNFPEPSGQGGQLGPESGIDPSSPAFRAAVNGPCHSLAPAAWLSSGRVER